MKAKSLSFESGLEKPKGLIQAIEKYLETVEILEGYKKKVSSACFKQVEKKWRTILESSWIYFSLKGKIIIAVSTGNEKLIGLNLGGEDFFIELDYKELQKHLVLFGDELMNKTELSQFLAQEEFGSNWSREDMLDFCVKNKQCWQDYTEQMFEELKDVDTMQNYLSI